jgi:hypothetical protein
VWAELTKQYGDDVEMIVVDRDTVEGKKFAEEHRIYYQPGFVVLDRTGKVTYEGLGPFDPKDVTKLVEAAAK